MANIYGVNVPVPLLDPFEKRVLEEVVIKAEEREIFEGFLETEVDGLKVSSGIYELAKDQARMANNNVGLRSEVTNATIKSYKNQRGADGFSAYDQLVFDLIDRLDGKRDLIDKLRRGKISPFDIPGFPGLRKRAEILLEGKIAGDIKPEDVEQYLTYKAYISSLRECAKDLFFAINHGGREKAADFLTLMYLLKSAQTSEPVTYQGLRDLMLNGLLNKTVIEIVHIKSLRFTYPEGKKLRMLVDTSRVEQAGLPGEARVYPSEEVIFQRLEQLEKTLNRRGMTTRETIIVSDLDLDYCFPEGQRLVPAEDILIAKGAPVKYIEFLRSHHDDLPEIKLLSEFLGERGITGEYERVFGEILRDEEQEGERYVKSRVLNMRISEQFEHYSAMFGSYSRDLARYTATRMIANVLALSVVFGSFSGRPLLVIDSRGLENELIGGYNPQSVVKYFTKLKDPTEIKMLK